MTLTETIAVQKLKGMSPAKLYDLLVELAPKLSNDQLTVVRGIAEAESSKRGLP